MCIYIYSLFVSFFCTWPPKNDPLSNQPKARKKLLFFLRGFHQCLIHTFFGVVRQSLRAQFTGSP